VSKKSEKRPDPDGQEPSRSLESTLKHAETGYRNAQDIIKFLDAKAGVTAGFAFLGIGFVLQVIKEIVEAKDSVETAITTIFGKDSFPTCVISAATILSLFAGVVCIWCVVRCMPTI
jgi:hypothetical protein